MQKKCIKNHLLFYSWGEVKFGEHLGGFCVLKADREQSDVLPGVLVRVLERGKVIRRQIYYHTINTTPYEERSERGLLFRDHSTCERALSHFVERFLLLHPQNLHYKTSSCFSFTPHHDSSIKNLLLVTVPLPCCLATVLQGLENLAHGPINIVVLDALHQVLQKLLIHVFLLLLLLCKSQGMFLGCKQTPQLSISVHVTDNKKTHFLHLKLKFR